MKKIIIYITFLLCSFIVNSQDFGIVTTPEVSIYGEYPSSGPYGNPNTGGFDAIVNLNNTITGVVPVLTLLSGDEMSFARWYGNDNDMNILESITVNFVKNVSVIEEHTYVFSLESIYHNKDQGIFERVVSNFTINVTFYPGGSCQLEAPSNIEITEITETSASINWSNVPESGGYDFVYGTPFTGNATYISDNTSSPSLTLSNLLPNETYMFRVQTICSTGFLGADSKRNFFHTLPVCESDIIVTDDVNGYISDSRSAEFTITATNKILKAQVLFETDYVGGVAKYNAGEKILLKPGFHAESGAVFNAFIEGCAATSWKSTDVVEKQAVLEKENVSLLYKTTIYPNPTTGVFTISSNETITNYAVMNAYGKRIKYQNTGENKVTVATQNLPTGMYMVQIRLASGEVVMKKLIKK